MGSISSKIPNVPHVTKQKDILGEPFHQLQENHYPTSPLSIETPLQNKIGELIKDIKFLEVPSVNCYNTCYRNTNNTGTTGLVKVEPKKLFNSFEDISKETPDILSSTASRDSITSEVSKECLYTPPKHQKTTFDYVQVHIQRNNVDNNLYKDGEISHLKFLNQDPRSPSIGIERTPIVIANNKEDAKETSKDTIIKVLQNTNNDFQQTVTHSQGSNLEELSIYEDGSKSITSDTTKIFKIDNNNKSETSFSCVDNKRDDNSAPIKLRSANIGFKSQNPHRRVSYIPRLKSLSKQTKVPKSSN